MSAHKVETQLIHLNKLVAPLCATCRPQLAICGIAFANIQP